MTNPFAQFGSDQSASVDKPAESGANAFSQFSGGGVSIDNEEQKIIGEVNSVRVQTPETFGLTRIPIDIGKGVAREMLATPQDIGSTLVEAGETAKAFSGKTAFQTAKTSFISRYMNNVKKDGEAPNIFEIIPMLWGVEKDVALNLAFDSDGASAVSGAGYNMIKENQRDLESMGLVPKGKTSVAYDAGQGFASVLKSVGLLAMTKNPEVAGAHMTWITNSRDYLEARKSGKTPEDSATIAAASAAGQGAIEVMGGKYFMAAARGSSFIKTTLQRILGQAVEETAQSGVEVTVKNVSGVRKQSLGDAVLEMGYSGLIGAIAGAPVAAATTGIENYGKSLGVPDKIAKQTAEKLVEAYPDLQDAGAALIDKETTGLGTDRSVVDASIAASKEAIKTKEAELTAQADKAAAGETLYHGTPEQFGDIETSASGMAFFAKDAGTATGYAIGSGGARAAKTRENSYYVNDRGIVYENNEGKWRAIGETDTIGAIISKENLKPIDRQKYPEISDEEVQQGVQADGALIPKSARVIEKNFSGLNTLDMRTLDGAQIISDLAPDTRIGKVVINAAKASVKSGDVSELNRALWTFTKAASSTGADIKSIVNQLEALGYDSIHFKDDQHNTMGVFESALNKAIKSPNEQKQADYETIANGTTQSRASKIKKGAKNIGQGIAELGSDIFTPISTRLGKINPILKSAIRRYAFNTGMNSTEDKKAIKPLVDGLGKMDIKDYRILDFALKNKDQAKVDEILVKYNLTEQFQQVRKTLDNIFDEAKEVGLDLNYIEEYFPRQVKRDMVSEYLAALRGRDDWSQIQAALDEVDPENVYTDEEKADFVNAYLRGFASKKILLAASGFTKERTVDYITPEFNKYYESSPTALIHYVDGMRFGIEARRLFGKDKAEGSIGDYVRQLVEEGSIDGKNEEEVKKILKALVDQQGTRGVVTWAKNASYIYTMGSPISAVTQLADLAFSLAENGYYNTGVSLGRAVFRQSKITKEDIGIEHIIQEFDGESSSAKAVRKIFKAVGLEYMDSLGKETYINSALKRLQKQAKGNSPEFQAYMEQIFGDEAKQTTEDLLNGTASENVKFLLFSELSDVQPISMAEMPVSYLNSGNGRVFYMLKTYTLKLLDVHRRKWIDEIASGDPKRMANGVKNLVSLTAALMVMGVATDALKDMLMGRKFNIDDLFVDNIIKLAGISRYQIYKSRDEGIMNAFWQTLFVPPIGSPINDLSKDVIQMSKGKRILKDSDTLQGVPVGGKLYYWWFGGGRKKELKKNKNTSSTL